jgi:DNA-binding HxlR family transcriptional regulator
MPLMDPECLTYIYKVSRVTEMLQGKWTLQILCAMRTEPVRLSQLMRFIPSASKKALRASLRALEAAEIVVRHDMSGIVLHVEYDFADNMRRPCARSWTTLPCGERFSKLKRKCLLMARHKTAQ